MPTIPPRLARALAEGARHAGDAGGVRIDVEDGPGWRRATCRPAAGGPAVEACRTVARHDPPPGWPAGAPHLPELSGVAVREGPLLAVTWPDETPVGSEEPPSFVPRGAGLTVPAGLAGGYAGSRATPGEAAALVRGAEALVARAAEEGWSTLADETLEGPVRGRVVRWARGDERRAMSLTESLGVVQLTFLEAPEPD